MKSTGIILTFLSVILWVVSTATNPLGEPYVKEIYGWYWPQIFIGFAVLGFLMFVWGMIRKR